ncbi:MAG: hypothetical protein NDI73_06805 [Desulfuromonadales bacterium]|nr:hypothetical protein [Desulfuromonadales bacterium]
MLSPNSDRRYFIEVILGDGTCHHLAPQVLDIMLDYDRVLLFKRSSGWVTVGKDPIRAKHTSRVCTEEYGPERRVAANLLPPPLIHVPG